MDLLIHNIVQRLKNPLQNIPFLLLSELKNLTTDIVGKNGWEMTRQIYERTKITSTEREMKDFYNKYVKSLRLKINEDGVFEIVVNEY